MVWLYTAYSGNPLHSRSEFYVGCRIENLQNPCTGPNIAECIGTTAHRDVPQGKWLVSSCLLRINVIYSHQSKYKYLNTGTCFFFADVTRKQDMDFKISLKIVMSTDAPLVEKEEHFSVSLTIYI